MQVFTRTFWLIIKLFVGLFLGLQCKAIPLLFALLSSYSQTYFQVQNARVYPYFFAHYPAILRLISRSRMQEFTLTFWLIIKLFLDLFLGRKCKSLPLLFRSLSSYSQTYFQVQNARVYPYFLAHYPAIHRLISRSRMQEFTLTFSLIIKLFLDLFLGRKCKSLPLLFRSLSSYSQTYFQVQNARVYPYFLAHYLAILRLISRSRKQSFTLTLCLISQLFLDLFLGLECKDLPILSCLLSSYSQTYFQVQNARVYTYFLAYYRAILRLISRSRMQGFTLTFLRIIELFLDLFLGLECKGLHLLSCVLSSYSQTYFQVQNARVYTYFLAYYRAILRLISRSRMQGFTLTFLRIIELFLDVFLGLECKSLPLLFRSLSSCSQTYFQVENARVYPYFFAHYPAILRLISRSRMQEFTLTFSLIIQLFLDLFLGLETKVLPLHFASLASYSQTYFQVQNARIYQYFLAYCRAILRCIYRFRRQGFTLTFLRIIELFLDLFLGLECKGLHLLSCVLSSYSQMYFQVQNARVYPYFLAYYRAILRCISRSRMQGFTLIFLRIIELFLDLFLGLECKGLHLLSCVLSSYSQMYFQVQNARIYPYFLAYYRAILRCISRSRMQGFTLTFLRIIELFLDLFLGLECKSLPLLFGSLSRYSQTYFQVQNARVYPYFMAHYLAILRHFSRSRMQGFTFTFWLIIKLFLDLFLGLECKGLHLLFGSLSSYIQTYFQVQKARVYPFFLAHYLAILRLISRSRMQGYTITFWHIIQLFLDIFIGLKCKRLPLLFGLLSSYSQSYFQFQKARVYPYFLAHYQGILRLISRSRKQRFTFTFWLIIHLFLNSFLGLECKGLPLLFGSLSSYSQTNFQVQKAKVYLYFLAQ